MLNYIQLDKILHNGLVETNESIKWDFHSSYKALAMINLKYGHDANCWQIKNSIEKRSDIMQLEKDLENALMYADQIVLMTLKEDSPAREQYDHYEFSFILGDDHDEEEEAGSSPRDLSKPVIVRISCMYSDDFDFSDYEEGEVIHIPSNAISASFMILEDDNQEEALDGREGELSTSFDYELHDGQLCAIVDGKFIPCEDDIEFECFLRKSDGEEM